MKNKEIVAIINNTINIEKITEFSEENYSFLKKFILSPEPKNFYSQVNRIKFNSKTNKFQ